MKFQTKPLLLSLLLLGVTATAVLADDEKSEQTEEVSTSHLPNRFRGLEYHPVGWTVKGERFRWTNLIRMQPPGFRADRFDQWLAPTYGLGQGWEATVGVTGAERIGAGGRALFFGAGVQKQFVTEQRGLPSVSLGAFGMAGPHDHHGGRVYLSATKRVAGGPDDYFALDLHGGVKYELYDGDDYGSSSGVAPFVGLTAPIGHRVFFSADFSPSLAWQRTNMYSAGVTYRAYKRLGITGGIRNNGYRTQPFISFSL